MKKCGGNGEVLINEKNGTATKTLIKPKDGNRKSRFIQEMKVLQRIRKESLDAIVDIIGIDEDNMKIIMKAYDSDIREIYADTKGNIKHTLNLLLPIVKALKSLSELDTPIYHRDIKPQNILVERKPDSYRLILTDFGCAYIDNNENKRLTDDFRAVGAQQYRAPEYQYGKVSDVDEKGDIFSIGKMLWNLINGIPDEVFPYTLWFPNEYNLSYRFDNSVELLKLNNLIGSCVNYDIKMRPTYQQIIEEMECIIDSTDNQNDEELNLYSKIKIFEAKRILNQQENFEKKHLFLATYYQDFEKTLNDLKMFNLDILNRMIATNDYLTNKRGDVDKIIKTGIEIVIFDFSYEGIYFQNSYLS